MRARGAGVSYDKWLSGGQPDIQHFFGAPAEELYLPGNFASPNNIVGSIAGNALTPVTTPRWREQLAPPDAYGLGAALSWTNVVGCSLVGNVLTKTAANGWGNAGAISSEKILSGGLGVGGYVEWTLVQNVNDMIGLSAPPDVNQSFPEIDYALYAYGNATAIVIYELGVYKTAISVTMTPGITRFRIEVDPYGTVRYYANEVLKYTSATTAPTTLEVDCAIHQNGSGYVAAQIRQRAVAPYPLAVGYDYYTSDSHDAVNGAVHNYGTGPFAVLSCFRILLTSSATGAFIGKTDVFTPGWSIRGDSSPSIGVYLYGASTFVYQTRSLAGMGNQILGLLAWRAADLSYGIKPTWMAEATGDSTTVGSISSTTPIFSLGSCMSTLSADMIAGPQAIWSGANASTVIANRATTVPAWWAA
jgi:hypothetical protein